MQGLLFQDIAYKLTCCLRGILGGKQKIQELKMDFTGFLKSVAPVEKDTVSSFYGLKNRYCKNESFHKEASCILRQISCAFPFSYFRKYITLFIEFSFLHPAIKNLRRKLPSLRMDKPNLRMNLQCKVDKSGRYARLPFYFLLLVKSREGHFHFCLCMQTYPSFIDVRLPGRTAY